jgi:phosphohistidine phosphatase SixA
MADNFEGRQTAWSDAALDVDSQQVADFINAHRQAGDSLFVWGYRPDVYVYTRLIAPGKFWDSQPLDGVPADRHLQSSVPSSGVAVLENRERMVQTTPSFVVDGLGKLNPGLGPEEFPKLRAWLRGYRVVKETRYSRIYERSAE